MYHFGLWLPTMSEVHANYTMCQCATQFSILIDQRKLVSKVSSET